MQALTPDGQRIVEDVAQRHGVSTDAVVTLLYALVAGGGTMAQFSHPDLGGMGQWSQGGMIMVGDMFNQGLKYRVDSLCNDLANLLRANNVFASVPASSQSQYQGSGPPNYQNQNYQNQNYQSQGSGFGAGANVSLFVPGSGGGMGNWWPADLGSPSSTGGQNNMSYACFPGSRRLAILNNGQVTVYDTGDHNIGGFSQQQGGDQSLTFTSQYGIVRVNDLPIVGPNAGQDFGTNYAPAPAPQQAQPAPFQPAANSSGNEDIFGKIEQLAGLRQKGVLTDDEFSAKKAELLSRL